MKNTSHLGLKKPGSFDLYAVQDFNYNAEVIDEAIKNASAMGAEVVSQGTGRYLQSTQNNMTGFYDATAYIGTTELVVENIPTMSTSTELVKFAGMEYTEPKVLEVGVATSTYFIWSDNLEPFTIDVQYSIMGADGTGERLIGNVTKEISNIVPNVSNTITMELPIEHQLDIGEQLIHRIYVITSIMSQKVSVAFGGLERPSRFIIPLTMGHNDLAGLQGGVAGEHYHLSRTQHDKNLLNDGEGSGLFNMFTEAAARENLASGERQNISFGKMKKWFTDLKAVAWSGNASDLVEDANNRLVTDSEKSTWNAKVDKADGANQMTDSSAYGNLGTAANATQKTINNAINLEMSSKVDITDPRLSDARPASDVYPWAKEEEKPIYTASEVGALPITGGEVTGSLTIPDRTKIRGTGTGNGNIAHLDFYDNNATTRKGWVGEFAEAGNIGLGSDFGDIKLKPASGKNAYVNTDKIWHAGNDGVGSGLDADLLDGREGHNFIFGANQYGTSDGRIDLNTIDKTGMYWASSATNKPATENGTVFHINYDSGSAYATQMFIAHDGSLGTYVRSKSNSTWNAWEKIPTEKSGAAFNGQVSVPSGMKIKGTGIGATNGSILQFMENNNTTRRGWIGDGGTGNDDISLGSDIGNVVLVPPSGKKAMVNGNDIYHTGNDGAGSGLDADLLDGKHGSEYSDKTRIANKILYGSQQKVYEQLFGMTTDTSTTTGTLKITLPHTWNSTMMLLEIDMYNYGTAASSKTIIGGYNYSSGNWTNTSATVLGKAPFTSVRFGHDGSKCCILLGTTATVWNYLKIDLCKMLTGFNGSSADWRTGWDMSFITDEADITVSSTPDMQRTTSTSELNGKANNVLVTQTSAGLMSSTDKTKLDGMSSGANNYVHPATHPPSIIAQDASNRFVTDTEKTTWNGKVDRSDGANQMTDSTAYANLGTLANATQKTINAAINSRITSVGSDLVIPIGGSLDITKSTGTVYPAIEAFEDGMILDSTDGDLFIGGSSTRSLYLGGTTTYAANLVLQGDVTSNGAFNQGSWNTPKSGMITQITDNSNAQHSVIVGLKSDGVTRSYGMDLLDSDTNMQMRLYAGNDYLEINDTAGGIIGSGHIRATGMLKGNGARVLLKSEYVCSYMEVGQVKDISIPSNCIVTKIEFNWSDYDAGTSQMNGYHFDTTTVSEGKVYTRISGTTTTYDVLTSGLYDSTYLLTGNSPETGDGVSEVEIVNKGLTLKVNYSTDKLELDGLTQNSSNGNYDDVVLNSVNIYGYYTS